MGSELTDQSLRLPVIDFSVQPLRPETPEWETVRAQVQKAVEEFGCFEALFDKISLNTRKEIFQEIQKLFDLPLETKKLNVSNKPLCGYSEYNTQEALTIDDANISQKVESFTSIMWPQENPSFCKTVHSYSEQLMELDQIIRRIIFQSLGIENYLEEHLKSTDYTLRLMKYKKLAISETKQLGLTVHTDKGIMTIMSQNEVDGYEVQTKEGQWISVKPSPGSFVVTLGDALACVLANGRLRSPPHRVMITGSKIRYSTGFASNPIEDYLIKTPEELVDEEHPLKFKPYYHFDFLRFLMTKYTRKTGESSIETYCGI